MCKTGSLKTSETMLTCQAVALNAIFTELARRSALNMGEYLTLSTSPLNDRAALLNQLDYGLDFFTPKAV